MVSTRNEEKIWEGHCRQCGLCCFEKLEDEKGRILFTSTPCRYLDLDSRRCRIYKRRFDINPDCVKLTPERVESLSWLHDSCGYRQALGLQRRTSRET
jgi:uncharacterized cysteine cluster protein YcgN (CxxCxxCC family)